MAEPQVIVSAKLPIPVGQALWAEATERKMRISPLIARIITEHYERQQGQKPKPAEKAS